MSDSELVSDDGVYISRPPLSIPSSISSSQSDLTQSLSDSLLLEGSSSSGFLSSCTRGLLPGSRAKSRSRSSLSSMKSIPGEATTDTTATSTSNSNVNEKTREESIQNLNRFSLEPITEQNWDLEGALHEYRPMSRSEVWAHSQNGDILVIRFNEVLNLASLFAKILEEGDVSKRKRLSPIYKYKGKDVTHWFDPITEDPRTRVDLETGKKVIYAPDGLYYGLYTYEKRLQEASGGDKGLTRPSATFFESFMMSSILIEREAEGIFDEHPKNNSQLEQEIVSRVSIRSRADPTLNTPTTTDSSNETEHTGSDDHGGIHSDGDIPNEKAIKSSKRHLNMSSMATFSDEFDQKLMDQSLSKSKGQKPSANKENSGEIKPKVSSSTSGNIKYDGPESNFPAGGANSHSESSKIRPPKRNIQVSQLFSGSNDKLVGGDQNQEPSELGPGQGNILEATDTDSESDENSARVEYDGPQEDFRAYDDDTDDFHSLDGPGANYLDDSEIPEDLHLKPSKRNLFSNFDEFKDDGDEENACPLQDQNDDDLKENVNKSSLQIDGYGANYLDDSEIPEDLHLKPSKRNLFSNFDEFKDVDDENTSPLQDQNGGDQEGFQDQNGDDLKENVNKSSLLIDGYGANYLDDSEIPEDLHLKPSKRNLFSNFDEFKDDDDENTSPLQDQNGGDQEGFQDQNGDDLKEDSQKNDVEGEESLGESDESDKFQGPEDDFKENDDDDQENEEQSSIFGANFHSDDDVDESLKIKPSKRNLIPKFDDDVDEDDEGPDKLKTIKPANDGSELKRGLSSSEGLVVTSDEIPGPESHLNELSNEKLVRVRPSKRNVNLNDAVVKQRQAEEKQADVQVKKMQNSVSSRDSKSSASVSTNASSRSDRSTQSSRDTGTGSTRSSQSSRASEEQGQKLTTRPRESPDYDEGNDQLWWRNSNYIVGYVPEKTFFVRVINSLNGDEKLLEACRESTINDLLRAYIPYNSRAMNYLWTDIFGNVLHPHRKLSENGLMANIEVCEMGLDHFPDGYELEPNMNNGCDNQCLNLPCRTY